MSWFNVIPDLTASATITSYPITTQLPPYCGLNSYTGILLSNASKTVAVNSVIIIGDINYNENVFDKLRAGIFNLGSNESIQKMCSKI